MPYKKRQIFYISESDKARLKLVAESKQTSLAQLIREAIRYMLLNVWFPKKKEDYE